MSVALTRRQILAATAALGAGGLVAPRPTLAAPVAGLEILGAPNGATIVLADLVASGGLESVAPAATFRLWRTTDDLRASIVSGRAALFSTPSHVPANLANRGLPVKIAAIIGMGHLAVVTADPTIQRFQDLAGKSVLGFFRNDMPDLVFRAIAKMEGMDPDKDIRLSYVQTPAEAAQMLVAGKVDTAILSEPPATSAILMAGQNGRPLRRALDLRTLWGAHQGKARIPMVAVALNAKIADAVPELPRVLVAGLQAARDRVYADRSAAAQLANRVMEIKPMVFEKAFDEFHIEVASAQAAKQELLAFYRVLLDIDPASVGDNLPGDDLFLEG